MYMYIHIYIYVHMFLLFFVLVLIIATSPCSKPSRTGKRCLTSRSHWGFPPCTVFCVSYSEGQADLVSRFGLILPRVLYPSSKENWQPDRVQVRTCVHVQAALEKLHLLQHARWEHFLSGPIALQGSSEAQANPNKGAQFHIMLQLRGTYIFDGALVSRRGTARNNRIRVVMRDGTELVVPAANLLPAPRMAPPGPPPRGLMMTCFLHAVGLACQIAKCTWLYMCRFAGCKAVLREQLSEALLPLWHRATLNSIISRSPGRPSVEDSFKVPCFD